MGISKLGKRMHRRERKRYSTNRVVESRCLMTDVGEKCVERAGG